MARVRGNWSNLFSPTILSRGRSYFSLGKAKKFSVEEYGYSVTVRGSKNYRVEFDIDMDGDIKYISCTCPYALQGERCKHMAAALFYLEKCLGHEVAYVGEGMPGDEGRTEKENEGVGRTDEKASVEEKFPQGKSYRNFEDRHASVRFEDLDVLRKKELAVRTSEDSSYAFVPSDYHYFNSDNFLNDIKTTRPAREMMAERAWPPAFTTRQLFLSRE